MFAKSKNGEVIAATSDSSIDWECEEGSRSSASWSDDLESEATLRLNDQLARVESALHGEAPGNVLSPALRQEVAQWRSTFPHLRLCGKQPPRGPRPSQEEEGQEEVLASHGSWVDDTSREPSDSEDESGPSQATLKEQLKAEVIQRLTEKLRQEVLSHVRSRVAREEEAPPVSASHRREPLLASRQQTKVEAGPKPQQAYEELNSILQVSPLPKRVGSSTRGPVQLPRSHVTLPPIDAPQESSRGSALPLSVLGRQSRLLQSRSKTLR